MKNFKKITHDNLITKDILNFINTCSQLDSVSYSFSYEDCDDTAVCINEKNDILGIIFAYDMGEYLELTGLVHPAYRRNHIFSRLIEQIAGDNELVFSGRDYYPVIKEFANSIGYTNSYNEYLMTHKGAFSHECALYYEDEDNTRYFYLDDNDNCVARFSYIDETDRINVFDVYVEPEYRQRGIGRQMMYSLGGQNIFLQVSEQNKAAMALYESCGFEIVNHILFLLK